MADWGMGATSKSRSSGRIKPRPNPTYFYQCVGCRMNYMTETKVEGEYRCPKCRKGVPIHTPSPPPASVQMTIEDVLKQKK